MKVRHFTIRVVGLACLATSLASGLAQNGVSFNPVPFQTTPPVKSATPRPAKPLSPWAGEVLKLTQAGIEESVMLSFIENSGTFNLGADQIIELSAQGVSTPVITAMLQHDADLASGVKLLTISSHPKMDPEVEKELIRLREADEKAAAATSTAPASAAQVDTEPAISRFSESAPEPKPAELAGNPARTDSPAGETPESSTPSTAPQQPSLPQQLPSTYRVPERYPVELAPPFLVINAATRTPNLVVIELFPNSR